MDNPQDGTAPTSPEPRDAEHATEPGVEPQSRTESDEATSSASTSPDAEALAAIDAIKAPGDISSLSSRPVFDPSAYAIDSGFGDTHRVLGHGAQKLSDSFVAPLVAAARGYRTFDTDQLDEAKAIFPVLRGRKQQARRIIDAIKRSDVMAMPWYSISRISSVETHPTPLLSPQSTESGLIEIQFRPGTPPAEAEEHKYEFGSGGSTPLAFHPSMPQDWLTHTPVVLIAEGLLKGDAALTGWLLENGITLEELHWDGQTEPTSQLRSLMQRVPVEDRICILTIAGVQNWKHRPEWSMLRLTGREVWVGFDGDIATNKNVHGPAMRLRGLLDTMGASKVKLLSPFYAEGKEGDSDLVAKCGIDDYLAKYGSWEDLVARCLTEKFPDPPPNAEQFGDVRVSKDECSVEEYVETSPDSGVGTWRKIYDFGGRFVGSVVLRAPERDEVRSGHVDPDRLQQAYGDPDQAEIANAVEVEIEVRYRAEDGTIVTASVFGPKEILAANPAEWTRNGARIPMEILRNPSWPPRDKGVDRWMKAIKAHRHTEQTDEVRWKAMGWVPDPNPDGASIPSFVVGKTVVTPRSGAGGVVHPGIQKQQLNAASEYGLGDVWKPNRNGDPATVASNTDEYRETVREAIHEVMDVYIGRQKGQGPWQDRRNAAVVLAAGLRPCLPMRPRAIPYFTGAKGTGKSWSANAVLAFWQAYAGAFEDNLPGSASDTAAAMELSVARSVVWVVDDVAPAQSRRKSDDEKDKIGSLIRNTFNGTGKARSNQKMGIQEVHNPRALLVITGENEPSVGSELERVVLCDMGYGALSASTAPTDRLVAFTKDDDKETGQRAAFLAGALIRHFQDRAEVENNLVYQQGWTYIYDLIHSRRDNLFEQVKTWSKGYSGISSVKRFCDTATDLAQSLVWLGDLAKEVDCDDWVIDLLDDESDNGLVHDVVDLVLSKAASSSGGGAAMRDGFRLVAALGRVLSSGRGYVRLADDPTSPPLDPGQDPHGLMALGWYPDGGGKWAPRNNAVPIGWFAKPRGADKSYIFFDRDQAFDLAATDPAIPAGQMARSTWRSVIGEGYVAEPLLREKKNAKEGELAFYDYARTRVGGVQIIGIPLELSVILGGGSVYAGGTRMAGDEFDDEDDED